MSRLFCIVAAVAVLSAAGVAAAGETSKDGAVVRGGQRASAALSGTPGSAPAVNVKTHTLYVPIQCQLSCNDAQDNQHVLDLIDTAKCSARTVSECHLIATAEAGKGPLWAAIDPKTDTLYVADASGAVTVIDARHCNASVNTRCHEPLATIKTGGIDVDDVLNPRTHTLYVAAPGGSVYVTDVARCNSYTTRGCRQHVKRIKDALGPDGIDVDLATDTVYVANAGADGSGHTLWVINGARCNGSTGRGCRRKPQSITVGRNPFTVTVDQKKGTIYVPSDDYGTVSVIDGTKCNATMTSGCHRRPPTVATGAGAAQVVLDASRHTAFTVNQDDDTMSEFSTGTCNGRRQSGCPVRAQNEQATFKPSSGYNPNAFALVSRTGTAYLVNAWVINAATCNAADKSGFGHITAKTKVGLEPTDVKVNESTNTIYVPNNGNGDIPGTVSVIDGARCNGTVTTGCSRPWPEIDTGRSPLSVAIDSVSNRIYVADFSSAAVSVIDGSHCDAADTRGCHAKVPEQAVGSQPAYVMVDHAAGRSYVTEHGAAEARRWSIFPASP